MNQPRKRCPVCLRKVYRSELWNIEGHVDNIGTMCVGSGEPFRIALHYSEFEEMSA